MNPTQSEILYHFTGYDGANKKLKSDDDAFSTLLNILSSQELRLSINTRDWTINNPGNSHRFQIPIPMACLTETPLWGIQNHMRSFGKFGLGFNIDWAINEGAQNVIYYKDGKSSRTINIIKDILTPQFTAHGYTHKPSLDWTIHILGLTEDIVFRNEREWRFIGDVDSFEGGIHFSPNGIKFQKSDVTEIFIKMKYHKELIQFLNSDCRYNDHSFQIIDSDSMKFSSVKLDPK